MPTTLHRAFVFALYQLTLFAGILLMPLALVMRKAGVTLPVHRAVDRVNETYDDIEAESPN